MGGPNGSVRLTQLHLFFCNFSVVGVLNSLGGPRLPVRLIIAPVVALIVEKGLHFLLSI